MDLKTFIQDPARRDRLINAIDSSGGYLWQIATGWKGRKPSAEFARRIHDATDGVVSVHELRPDIFGPAPQQQPSGEAA